MTLVNVNNLDPGLVLAQDVLDNNAKLLLVKGQTIKNEHIRIMKMRGIFEVEVDGLDQEDSKSRETVNSERLEQVGQAVKKKFQLIDIAHPTIKEVVKICLEHRLKLPETAKTPLDLTLNDDNQKKLSSKDIMARIDRFEVKLPEVPSLVFELNQAIADPMSSAADIAQVINRSPSMAATLLKIVNSAFYGLRSKVDSLSRAAMLMGSKEVTNLAMAITIMETFKDIPKEIMDVGSFLEHNLACGMLARILAAHGNIPQTERIFVAGMLHDIGRLILYKYFPDYAILALIEARQSNIPLFKAEQKILGCTHTHLGNRLLNKWKLPTVLTDNVYFHHNPSSASDPMMASALQMADIIIHGLDIGHSAEHIVPAFDDKAWERLNLPISSIRFIIRQARHQVENFRDLLKEG
jgi:putative nucleotidyltransferase with HDIG domain